MSRYDPVSVFPIFVIFIILIGIVYANISRSRFLNETIAQSSPQPGKTSEPFPTASPNPAETPVPTQNPSQSPRASVNASTSTSQSSDLNSYHYPNSKITNQTSTKLEMTSTESPNAITEWYKAKIKSLGLTTNSMTTTNANNNILNVMAAAGNGKSVKVEIKKDNNAAQTSIKVEL